MDRELEALVARLPAGAPGAPDPAAARAAARAFTTTLVESDGRAGLTVDDRRIAGPEGGPEVLVRVYQPPRGADAAACVLYFHGGGFIAGDLDTEDARCVRLARDAGCVRTPAARPDCMS